ncbi:MAG: hypothetical protein Tsb009_31290 [Planctomycetaceae bacterium]
MTANGHDFREWIHEVLEKFEGPLVRYAQRILGDVERARDATQETFLRIVPRRCQRIRLLGRIFLTI